MSERLDPADCPREHRGPQGPNEDIAMCACWAPTWAMRPDNEQIGLHADDCSLPLRHSGYCVGGGDGHAPVEVVRGFWPGMEADIAAARAKHAGRPSMSACPLCDGDRTAVEAGATYTVWLCARCGIGREEYLQESFDRRRHP